jgi:hypothetical protein
MSIYFYFKTYFKKLYSLLIENDELFILKLKKKSIIFKLSNQSFKIYELVVLLV